MPMQTITSQITLATTGGNSIFDLVELTDDKMVFKGLSFNGVNYTPTSDRPTITISRVPGTVSGRAPSYTTTIEHSVYDALGAKVGTHMQTTKSVLPASYTGHANALTGRMQEIQHLLFANSLVKGMMVDGSWGR